MTDSAARLPHAGQPAELGPPVGDDEERWIRQRLDQQKPTVLRHIEVQLEGTVEEFLA